MNSRESELGKRQTRPTRAVLDQLETDAELVRQQAEKLFRQPLVKGATPMSSRIASQQVSGTSTPSFTRTGRELKPSSKLSGFATPQYGMRSFATPQPVADRGASKKQKLSDHQFEHPGNNTQVFLNDHTALEKKDAEIQRLQTELADARHKLQTRFLEWSEAQAAKTDLSCAKDEIVKLKDKILKMQEYINTLSEKKHELEGTKKALQARVEDLEKQVAQYRQTSANTIDRNTLFLGRCLRTTGDVYENGTAKVSVQKIMEANSKIIENRDKYSGLDYLCGLSQMLFPDKDMESTRHDFVGGLYYPSKEAWDNLNADI